MVLIIVRFYTFMTYCPKESCVLNRMFRFIMQDCFVCFTKTCTREEGCIGSGYGQIMIWSALISWTVVAFTIHIMFTSYTIMPVVELLELVRIMTMRYSKSWGSTTSSMCVDACSVTVLISSSTPCHSKSTTSSCGIVPVKTRG